MRGGNLTENAAQFRVQRVLTHHVADVVRLVNAQNFLQDLRVGQIGVRRRQRLARIAAPRQLHNVRLQFFPLVGGNQVGNNQIAVFDK